MVISYTIIVGVIAYIFGAITKVFVEAIPDRFIPLQNVIIGIVSGLICFFFGIETDILQAIVLCLIATMSAGGVADLVKIIKK